MRASISKVAWPHVWKSISSDLTNDYGIPTDEVEQMGFKT
jgi:hypothetical protein